MKRLDFHFHADTDERDKWSELARQCRELETVLAICGGIRYGERDYLPNDDVLKFCNENPDCFVPLAKLDLWETADPDEVYRYADAGFKGFKCIYPYYEYDHDLYMPVYEAAEKCNLPILFHTGNYRPCKADTIYRRPMLRNMHPITLDRICRSFPGLNVVMAHLGTRIFQEEASHYLGMLPNLYADMAGVGQYMRIQGDELFALLTHDMRLLDTDLASFRKMILGSDGYVTMPHLIANAQRYYEQIFKRIYVDSETMRCIMGKTAASWLGIELDE